jgi:hypothetical protein
MSDILERLRTVDGCTQKTFMHRLNWAEGRQIIAEAAAEIERLRALITEGGPSPCNNT